MTKHAIAINGKHVRPAAVAGKFYPSNPEELSASIQFYLSQAAKSIDIPSHTPPKAIIVPHAGYAYSGLTAAMAYNSILPRADKVTRVVMMGPCHRIGVVGLALPSKRAFSTPLGLVPIDADATAKIIKLDQVRVFDDTHKDDHALEVHLPFLQTTLNDFSIVPLIVGQTEVDEVAEVLEILWGGEETLILISSDLSHYKSYEQAQKIDAETCLAIEKLDNLPLGNQQACGRHSINGLIKVARDRGLEVTTSDLRNSGDTAGSKNKVVGYGSWLFSEPQVKKQIREIKRVEDRAEDKFGNSTKAILDQYGEALMVVASKAIKNSLRKKKPMRINLSTFPEELRCNAACFVTLNKDGKLRGCVGSIQAWRPLVTDVAENACKAAFQDARFPELTSQELKESKISLHISVLSPQVPLSFANEEDLVFQLRPGLDGIVLVEGKRRGVFLPVVWESLPEPKRFLGQLKRKAGLPENYWSDSVQAFRYVTRSVSSEQLPAGTDLWQFN